MNHNTRIRTLLCALPVLFLVSTCVRGGSRRSYDGIVRFPPQIVQLNSGCIWIDGTLTAGRFFQGLARKDRDGVFEFTHGGELLTDYPQAVVASIRILDDQCVSTSSPHRFSLASSDRRSFWFRAAWKTGLQLRPASLSSSVDCIGSSGRPTIAPPMTCQMTVESQGTPLSDHLIVSIFGPDGKRLSRLSAAP
jgi:hypothetical protein